MRLIDADALKGKVINWLPSDPCGIEEKERPIETDMLVSLIMEIEEAPTIEVNEDCISREWVLEEFQKGRELLSKSEFFAELMWLVKHAPSVMLKEKTGKWVRVPGYATPGGDPVWECSKCGKGRHVYGIEASSYQRDVSNQQWVACPSCGAKMRLE